MNRKLVAGFMIKIIVGAIVLAIMISLQGCASSGKSGSSVSELGTKYPTKISSQVQPYTPEQLANHQSVELQKENEQLKEELEREKKKNLELQQAKQDLIKKEVKPVKVEEPQKEDKNQTPTLFDEMKKEAEAKKAPEGPVENPPTTPSIDKTIQNSVEDILQFK